MHILSLMRYCIGLGCYGPRASDAFLTWTMASIWAWTLASRAVVSPSAMFFIRQYQSGDHNANKLTMNAALEVDAQSIAPVCSDRDRMHADMSGKSSATLS